jgi:hypothetical protein
MVYSRGRRAAEPSPSASSSSKLTKRKAPEEVRMHFTNIVIMATTQMYLV